MLVKHKKSPFVKKICAGDDAQLAQVVELVKLDIKARAYLSGDALWDTPIQQNRALAGNERLNM